MVANRSQKILMVASWEIGATNGALKEDVADLG